MLLLIGLSLRTSALSPSVVVVNFDVPVDPGSAALMGDAVSMAQAGHSPAIVIEMNTPGGLLSDMQTIIGDIQQANTSGIPTYTYVPQNSLAASAGSYIAMASNRILMGAGSEIGPSTPIVVGGTSLEQNHTQAAMLQLLVSLADKWGRNATAAYAMVNSDVAYSTNDAVAYHVVDGRAGSLQEALSTFGLAGESTNVTSEGVYDQILSALSDATLDGILILVGTLAITIDLYHPTIILSAAGIVAVVAGLVGAEVIGASLLGIVIVAIGAALMFLEFKLGHGFAMMGGAVVGAAGVYLLLLGVPFSPSPVSDLTEVGIVGIAAVGVLGGLYVRWIIGPLRKRRGLTGPEALVGKEAKVVSPLVPEGEVRVEGVTWRAKSISGNVGEGEAVMVRSIEGLRLVVEKVRTP